jgi:hypothetical protein
MTRLAGTLRLLPTLLSPRICEDSINTPYIHGQVFIGALLSWTTSRPLGWVATCLLLALYFPFAPPLTSNNWNKYYKRQTPIVNGTYANYIASMHQHIPIGQMIIKGG